MTAVKKPHAFRCSEGELRQVFWLYRNGVPASVIPNHVDVSKGQVTKILRELAGNLTYDFTKKDLPPLPNIEEILAIRYVSMFVAELSLVLMACPQCRHEFVVIKHSVHLRCTKCLHPFQLKTEYRPVREPTRPREIPDIGDIKIDTSSLRDPVPGGREYSSLSPEEKWLEG